MPVCIDSDHGLVSLAEPVMAHNIVAYMRHSTGANLGMPIIGEWYMLWNYWLDYEFKYRGILLILLI